MKRILSTDQSPSIKLNMLMNALLTLSSIIGGGNSDVIITLEGYEGELTRMRLSVSMTGPGQLSVVIEDKGLGVFTQTKARKWEEEIKLP